MNDAKQLSQIAGPEAQEEMKRHRTLAVNPVEQPEGFVRRFVVERGIRAEADSELFVHYQIAHSAEGESPDAKREIV